MYTASKYGGNGLEKLSTSANSLTPIFWLVRTELDLVGIELWRHGYCSVVLARFRLENARLNVNKSQKYEDTR